MAPLPSFVPYPSPAWRDHLTAQDWDSLTSAWLGLTRAYLSLTETEFRNTACHNESLSHFLRTFMKETASGSSTSRSSPPALLRAIFDISARLLQVLPPPELLSLEFLSAFASVYPKKATSPVFSRLFTHHGAVTEASLSAAKKRLIPLLDAGIKGDLKAVESDLSRLNRILHVSPDACTLFLAGSDFFDGLVTCFRVMNPPLRKVIAATMFLCIIGLTEANPAKWSMTSDQLFTLKAAADEHQQGPLNANDSLVLELVTSTPILKSLLKRAEEAGAATDSFKKRITALEAYKKGPMARPKRLVRRRLDKGKGKSKEAQHEVQAEMHVHRMSQISQIQDLFPDLGAGFISRCLDEYHDDVEQVVASLLGESLPADLASADRTEPLSVTLQSSFVVPVTDQSRSSQQPAQSHELAPRATPPQLPSRRNKFDDDEFDQLAMDVSKVTFGKRPAKTADEVLEDKSQAPTKAAIMSALAAFDSDDDERDDTYDVADVGGVVDSTNQEADGVVDGQEQTLFRAYQMDETTFDRDAATRRGKSRAQLRQDTGMTDEAIEGWAVMLARNPQQKRRLEAKYAFSGQQTQLESTAWRASAADSGAEDGSSSREGQSNGRSRGQARAGQGANRGGRGGRGGSAAGPTGEKATETARKHKEANKGSRANHNRRDGRARKMARGGFPG